MRRRPAEQRAAARRAVAAVGWLLPISLACLCLLGPARAAGEATGQAFVLEPRLQVSETITDNSDPGGQQGQSDAITRLTAGLGWRARTGSLRGYLDYALTSVLYARHSDRNDLQNSLNANLVADLIDDRLQLLTAAGITRSGISAFGVQPGGSADSNANVAETRNLQIAPTLRGPLGPWVVYNATLNHAISNTVGAGIGDSTTTSANLHLAPASRARLGWTLDASHLTSDFKQGRSTRSERLFGGAQLNLDELDLQLTATGGTERTDQISLNSARYSTWGVGAVWTPSPVTRISGELEERFFGRSHSLVVEHRTARTVFQLRSARSLSTSGNQVLGVVGPAGELLNQLLLSLVPDRAQRDRQVDLLLARLGINNPLQPLSTSFLQSAATLQDIQSFSAAWNGVRDLAVLTLSRSTTRRVDTIARAFDDLSRVGEVRTTDLSLNLSHRLTPLANLGLVLSVQRASSGQSGLAALSSRQTQAELQYSTRLSPDSTVSASLRRAHYMTGGPSSNETALSANYAVRF